MSNSISPERRSGEETRSQILSIALKFFIEKGYERTSTRDIAEALGMTKSSLYYHFRNKEDILISLIQLRHTQLEELQEWLENQPLVPDLLERTAHRWIECTTPERLQVMILSQANQPIMLRLHETGQDIRTGFQAIIDRFVDNNSSAEARLLVRMTLDTISSALSASRGTDIDFYEVLSVARQTASALAKLAVRAKSSDHRQNLTD
ncbi:TetR/AcrR family transcriptional regulator [Paenibacillus sp. WQ 127069]|uniref:TetR/AcrR family transcriptional regulator n=1 Tax=Paenibacillus baimaensis TaxID=2982185 RepID=A0ABT2UNG0_9BACL|nr:TetR/AcrR family transcriptional regulator [Paenibacillus sp. WQ 127069]MCU6795621.1 TetR/AcrR family transcriptional regulator [Paenibacillus sp. WQ 127069]